MVTTSEQGLVVFTVVIILTGGFMAALIGFVLPSSLLRHESEKESNPGSYSKNNISVWIQKRNQARTYAPISNYKWLVSISIPLYYDAKYNVYACSGAIVAKDEVLTGKGCITNNNRFHMYDFNKAIVRSSSEYYSYGGQTHKVESYSFPYHNDFVLLKITPHFEDDMIINKAEKFHGLELEAVGWGGMRVTAENLLKYEKFYITNWVANNGSCNHIQKCQDYCTTLDQLRGVVCQREAMIEGKANFTIHKGLNGRVLVNKNDHALLGMEFDALPEYNCTNDDLNVAFLAMAFAIPGSSLPVKLCTKQKGDVYIYEATLFKPK